MRDELRDLLRCAEALADATRKLAAAYRAERRAPSAGSESLSSESLSSDDSDDAPCDWVVAVDRDDVLVLRRDGDVFLCAGMRVHILLRGGEHRTAKVLDVMGPRELLVDWEDDDRVGSSELMDVRCVDEVLPAPDDGRWRAQVSDEEAALLEAVVTHASAGERAHWHPWLRVADDLVAQLGHFGTGVVQRAARDALAACAAGTWSCERTPPAHGACDICGQPRALTARAQGVRMGSHCLAKLEAIRDFHALLRALAPMQPRERARALADARDAALTALHP